MRLRLGAMRSEFQPSGARIKAPILKQVVGVRDVPEARAVQTAGFHVFERLGLLLGIWGMVLVPPPMPAAMPKGAPLINLMCASKTNGSRLAPHFFASPDRNAQSADRPHSPRCPDASSAHQGTSTL
jgi:hypothetical protein